MQTRQEPQRGPGKHFRGAPLGRKICAFLKMAHFWCTLYF